MAAQAYLPSLADIGDASLPLERIGHGRRKIQIPMADLRPWSELGGWGENHVRRVCQDVTGRWRDRHAFIVETRKGTACVHCGRLRPSDRRRLA